MKNFKNLLITLERTYLDAKANPRGTVLFFIICIIALALFTFLLLDPLLCLGCISIFAGIFFPLLLKEWRAGFSLIFVLIGAVLLLQGQPWFQGFFKANFISMFSSQMTRYGAKFEELTEAAQAMYNDLEINRTQMSDLQKTIEAQQSVIAELHTRSETLLNDVQERQETVDTTVSNFSQQIAIR